MEARAREALLCAVPVVCGLCSRHSTSTTWWHVGRAAPLGSLGPCGELFSVTALIVPSFTLDQKRHILISPHGFHIRPLHFTIIVLWWWNLLYYTSVIPSWIGSWEVADPWPGTLLSSGLQSPCCMWLRFYDPQAPLMLQWPFVTLSAWKNMSLLSTFKIW